MKKLICILLAVIMAASPLCVTAFAAGESAAKSPAIVTTGYFECLLYEDTAFRTAARWDIPKMLGAVAVPLLTAAALTPLTVTSGGRALAGRLAGKAAKASFGFLACNPDGSSVRPYHPYTNEPEKTSYKYLSKNDPGVMIEKDITAALAKELGEDRVFTFSYDFRMSAYDIACELNDFADKVLKYTGAEKVSLFGMSYGGLICGTCVSLFGKSGKFDNVVLDVPALSGASFPARMLDGKSDIQLYTLTDFADFYLAEVLGGFFRGKLSRLFSNRKSNYLDEIIQPMLGEIAPVAISWASFWDLIGTEDYTRLKAVYLDENENAEIIRKCDIIHYEVMPNYAENFAEAEKNGTKISIVADYTDCPCFLGGTETSDFLLDSRGESGAFFSPAGETLPDGYVQSGTVCADKAHNHLSPDGRLDASAAYLPDSTWFVRNQYHGSYASNEMTLSLCTKLMLSDGKVTVFDLADYPQFLDAGQVLAEK